MLIRKAQITYLLYPARRLYLPRGPRPSFQTKSAITPRSRRTLWAAARPGKVEDWGELARFARAQSSAFPCAIVSRVASGIG